MTENKNRLRVQPTPVVFKDEVAKPVKKTVEKSEKKVEKPIKLKATKKPESKVAKRRKEHNGRGRICFGILIFLISVFLLIAFACPYLGLEPKGKWLNYLGEEMSLNMFGLGTAYIIFLIGLLGVNLMCNKSFIKGWTLWKYGLIFVLWVPIFLALILDNGVMSNWKFYGLIGYKCFAYSQMYIGTIGVILLLVFTAFLYVFFTFNIKFDFLKKKESSIIPANEDEAYEEEPEPVINRPLNRPINQESLQKLILPMVLMMKKTTKIRILMKMKTKMRKLK